MPGPVRRQIRGPLEPSVRVMDAARNSEHRGPRVASLGHARDELQEVVRMHLFSGRSLHGALEDLPAGADHRDAAVRAPQVHGDHRTVVTGLGMCVHRSVSS